MSGHGGRRDGAGRKPRSEPQKLIAVRATDEELVEIQSLDTRERARVLLQAAQLQGEKKGYSDSTIDQRYHSLH